jgi:hypothetical protein
MSTTASIGCANHFFGVHRHQVAEFEAGRAQEHLAQRDGWKLDRQGTCRQNATLHGIKQFREMPVAIVEAGSRIGNADHGLGEHFMRIAHRLRKRAAQVKGKVAIPIIGEAVLKPNYSFCHLLVLRPSRYG